MLSTTPIIPVSPVKNLPNTGWEMITNRWGSEVEIAADFGCVEVCPGKVRRLFQVVYPDTGDAGYEFAENLIADSIQEFVEKTRDVYVADPSGYGEKFWSQAILQAS